MKYIVTGGLGFIGFHLVKDLLANGDSVAVFDNLSSGYGSSLGLERRKVLETYGNILWYKGDIASEDVDIRPYLSGCHGIFHLAARAGAGESFQRSEEYFRSNVIGTQKIFSIAKDLRVPVVYASSSSVYSGGHPYAATKRITEEVARMYGEAGVSNEGFRFYTVYGQFGRPDMSLYRFTHDMITQNKIRVAKDTFREYTHVSDVVWKMRQSMRELMEGEKKSRISDISSGEQIPILSAALRIAEILELQPEVELFHRENWDPAFTKSASPLGVHAFFSENIKSFVDWASEHVRRNR